MGTMQQSLCSYVFFVLGMLQISSCTNRLSLRGVVDGSQPPTMKTITSFSDPALKWFHEPPYWHVDTAADTLEVGPGFGGDLWSRTYYPWAEHRDHFNASALLAEVPYSQNASLELVVTLTPEVFYDQAGSLILVDENTWIKAGIEYFAIGGPHLSVVVTNDGFSDWSTTPMQWNNKSVNLHLRVTKVVHDVEQGASLYVERMVVEYGRWELVRLLPVRSTKSSWRWGPMACAPSAPAHKARALFSKITLGPEIKACLQC